MAAAKKTSFTCEITEAERKILEKYCEQEGRSKVDVIRELIKKLKRKINDEEAK